MLVKITRLLMGGEVLHFDMPMPLLVSFYVLLLALCFWGRLTSTVVVAAVVMILSSTIGWWGQGGLPNAQSPELDDVVRTLTYLVPLLALVVGMNVEMLHRFREGRLPTDWKVKGWLLTPLMAISLVALLLTVLDHFVIGLVVFGLGLVFELIVYIRHKIEKKAGE